MIVAPPPADTVRGATQVLARRHIATNIAAIGSLDCRSIVLVMGAEAEGISNEATQQSTLDPGVSVGLAAHS